jgi:glycosyltransferase involved in cell wall biosynthesis
MVYSPASRRGMEEVVRSFRPHVAHLHNIYHQLSPSVLRPLAQAGVPVVMTLHDYKLACPSYLFLDHGKVCEACLDGRFRHAVQRRCKDGSLGASTVLAFESAVHRAIGAYDGVGVFISPSRFLADRMAKAGVHPTRMHVLNNFVHARVLTPKRSPGGNVAFAGRLSYEKGVDVLIKAVARLGPGVELDIAGDGPERAGLEALAAARAPGRVHFHGRLPKERAMELVRSAAVLAVPSRWYENQPMVVLEAFGCGVPVVTSDLGGLPELVDPGQDGLVVPANDPEALAGALTHVLEDPDRGFAMGQAARAKALEAFTPEQHLKRLEALYHKAGGLRCQPRRGSRRAGPVSRPS